MQDESALTAAPATTRVWPVGGSGLLLDSAWRAAAYCLLPRAMLWSLFPILLTSTLTLALGWWLWEPAAEAARIGLRESAVGALLGQWLGAHTAASFGTVLAPILVIAVAAPLLLGVSLVLASMLITPAMVGVVARRRFAHLEMRAGGHWAAGLLRAVIGMLSAAMALVLGLPLWFTPLVAVLPLLIWGMLTRFIMGYDVLAQHADRNERVELLRTHRWPLLLIAVGVTSVGTAPNLLWALSAGLWIFAPLLVALSVCFYTLMMTFISLWFAHYLLAALAQLRLRGSSVSALADPLLVSASSTESQLSP